jgi:hypothetical protein
VSCVSCVVRVSCACIASHNRPHIRDCAGREGGKGHAGSPDARPLHPHRRQQIQVPQQGVR